MSQEVISIGHFETMHESSIATELAVRGWIDLNEKGLSDGTLNFHSGMRAILACAPDGRNVVPAGVMIWDQNEATKKIWVTISYVLPEFRGRGVYRALWDALVQMGLVLDASRIEGATHIRNVGMRAVAKQLGREERFVVLSYNLTR